MSAAERQRRYRKKHPAKAREILYSWRSRNKEKLNAIKKKYEQQRIDIITAAKSVPCTDCGVSYPPIVMDFDHVRGEKRTDIARMRGASIDALVEEIGKCEVVCANCHRLRTGKRGWSGGRKPKRLMEIAERKLRHEQQMNLFSDDDAS